MHAPLNRVDLQITSDHGVLLATLFIVERTPSSLFRLTDEDARERGEEPVQLVEGRSYEYELAVEPSYALRLRESVAVQPSRLSQSLGRIEPGLATGLLPIVLESETGEEVGRAAVEVRTSKLDYHHDYRIMLDYIAEMSVGLLLDINAHAQTRLNPDSDVDTPSLHQRFAFLNQLLTAREFRDAMNLIIATPHHRTATEIGHIATNRGIRPSRALLSSIARGSQRIPVPTTHPIHRRMSASGIDHPSLPRTVVSSYTYDTRDTPENRFVKFALTEFLTTISEIERLLGDRLYRTEHALWRDVARLKRILAGYLETELFRQVGPAQTLPLGSPVLQRRNGYRDVLSTWLKFGLAANLTWSGGNDVYGAGKKDVAQLYEYWLFFVLMDVLSHVLNFERPPLTDILDWSTSQFDLKLKSGTALSVAAVYRSPLRPMHVRFSYNRTYSGVVPTPEGSYPRPGSWTRSMRPDYSLSIWPFGLSEAQAELQDQVVHIHFDAKYRVESIVGLFGVESERELDDEDIAQRSNTRPKRSDLLKMHAYRDAIRPTEGAYVLYPGAPTGNLAWIEYHEILPGLGAFSVRPGQEAAAKAALTQFITDVLDHLSTAGSVLDP